jgi:hypothetical protein
MDCGISAIQEECPAIGPLKPPDVPVRRAGESALFVSKEFRFQQRLGQRSTVDLHERTIGSLALALNVVGQNLLAHASLAQDQNRGIRLTNRARQREHTLHRFPRSHRGHITAREILQSAAHGLQFEYLTDHTRQFTHTDRLAEEIGGSLLHGLNCHLNITICRQQNNFGLRRTRFDRR